MWDRVSACLSRAEDPVRPSAARLDLAANSREASPRRMLAVTQFFEDDDMAFVLDRMLSRQNPMSARLVSGRYFVRFVVIEDSVPAPQHLQRPQSMDGLRPPKKPPASAPTSPPPWS